ncbi:MAG: hypothetical protein RIR62_1054 [Pseudomonadota bacterium]|jgi:hypothetical protein
MIRALLVLLALPAAAAAQDCARLAATAGAAEGIPDGLLPAIALVESGHDDGQGGRAPWPWTLNRAGQSHYLADKDAALATLEGILATGATNVDLGCMQLNWRWHAGSFAGPAEMLDPAANTAYAARFLKELHAQLGSWELATAAYHSTDPDRGQAYLARVAAAQEVLAGEGSALLLAAVPVRMQGLLAVADSPLVALAAARAALVLQEPAVIDAAADPAPATAAPAPGTDRRAGPLPFAESPPDMIAEAALPRRLRARLDEVRALRRALAAAP